MTKLKCNIRTLARLPHRPVMWRPNPELTIVLRGNASVILQLFSYSLGSIVLVLLGDVKFRRFRLFDQPGRTARSRCLRRACWSVGRSAFAGNGARPSSA